MIVSIRDEFDFCTVLDEEHLKKLENLLIEIKKGFIEANSDCFESFPGFVTSVNESYDEKRRIAFESEPLIYEIELEKDKRYKIRDLNDLIKLPNEGAEKINKINCSFNYRGHSLSIQYNTSIFPRFRYTLQSDPAITNKIERDIRSFALSMKQQYTFIKKIPFIILSIASGALLFLLGNIDIELEKQFPHIQPILSNLLNGLFILTFLFLVLHSLSKWLFPWTFISIGDGKLRMQRIKFFRWLLGIGGIGGIVISYLISL